MKIANWILIAILTVFLLLGGATAIDYLSDYQSFRFGESLGWRYMSAGYYIGAFAAEILLAGVGLGVGAIASVVDRTLLIVRSLIVALLIATALS